MDLNYRHLETLSRAVRYANLTTASQNIGLSQAQLSRVVAELESVLGVELIDRRSKRKSGWRKEALVISDHFSTHNRLLVQELMSIHDHSWPKTIRCGSLEGLVEHVLPGLNKMRKKLKLRELHFSVLDQDQLVEQFERFKLDIIFTFAPPGAKKRDFEKVVGYQSVSRHDQDDGNKIYSDYEFGKAKAKEKDAVFSFVSNSLVARKIWGKSFGGGYSEPMALSEKKKTGAEPIYLIGAEHLAPSLWSEVESISFVT